MLFFRCTECHTVVSRKDIKFGRGCRKCRGGRISPTMLSFGEKFIEICRWPGMLFNPNNWKNETTLPGVGKGRENVL